MIFQDPMTSLNPLLTIGRQIAESVQEHQGLRREAAARARRSKCSDWWACPRPRSG